jgi:phosphoribosylformylglycinamidine synthase
LPSELRPGHVHEIPVKIDVVASPRKNHIESSAAAVVADISGQFPALNLQRTEQRVLASVAAGESGDWTAVANELGAAFASWDQRSVDVSVSLNPEGEPAAAGEKTAVEIISGWTPDSAKLRDLNGSAASAALPKVLAGLSTSASLSATSLDAATAGRKPFRARSVAVAQSSDSASRGIMAASANRYAALNPRQGSVIALVESLRELACRGATPLGITEDIRISVPATIEGFRRGTDAVRGLVEAATTLKLASLGNSLNASSGVEAPLVVAAIGAIEHTRAVSSFVSGPGDRFVFLGDAPSKIGASQYLRSVHGLVAGDVPAVDFSTEQKLRDVLNTLVKAGVVTSARDVSAGGLLSTLCAMLLGGEKSYGAMLDLTTLGGSRADALLFGESQGCAVITVPAERVGTVLSEAHMRGVSAALIGQVTEGAALNLKTRSLETEWSIASLLAAVT